MPRIDRLKPYGPTRDVVADVSQEICKKKGKKIRSEAKDEAVSKDVTSPYLQPVDHPLNLALITIIPAGKTAAIDDDSGQGDIAESNIPIPEPRPVN